MNGCETLRIRLHHEMHNGMHGDRERTIKAVKEMTERLNEIRAKLDHTRLHLSNPNATVQSNATTPNRRTAANGKSVVSHVQEH